MRTTNVIVPIRDRRELDRLLPIATEVADAYNAPIKIVHVVRHLDNYPTANEQWLETGVRRSGADLSIVENASVSAGLRDVLVGDSDAVVCMSVNNTGGRVDGITGSVTEDLLRSSHHRFVLIGPRVRASRGVNDGPVVVCVDGSGFAESILPDASDWANATSAAAWAVQVADESSVPTDTWESGYVHRIAKGLDVPSAEWEVLHDEHAADAIVRFASSVGAGSIAMSTHGRSGLARLTIGSIALRVVHDAACPVLVRRPMALSITPSSPRTSVPT